MRFPRVPRLLVFGVLFTVYALPLGPCAMQEPQPTGSSLRTSNVNNYDVIYPQLVDIYGYPTPRSHRRVVKRSAVTHWPQRTWYRLTVFNRTFLLDLALHGSFVAPGFSVHVLETGINDSSVYVKGVNDSTCFYSGRVRGDDSSRVALSLCRGMFGLIHTSEGDYSIEPASNEEVLLEELPDQPHIIFHLKEPVHIPKNGTASSKQIDLCGVKDTPSSASGRRRSHATRFHWRHRTHHNGASSSLRNSILSNVVARHKRSISHERHVEVMVAADSKMARYHGDNLKHYVLTLMSAVSLIYKDPSIGNALNIAVVKLMIMDEEEDRDMIYPSASKTLRNFCRWQQSHNHYDDTHPYHYDTAILLTREDLCREPKTCDTLGLAQSGMVCDRANSCAVVEDNGLSAVFTIAHELGHVLSIPHDDDHKCARFIEEGQRFHVMARMLDYNSHPWSWSLCSRHYVTEYLDAGRGQCLLDKPSENLLLSGEHTSRWPGELFDMDLQCELTFGKHSKICPYMPVCKRLWCTMNDGSHSGCRTQHMPWADGTPCGYGKWCQQGECIPNPVKKMEPVNGGWGPWRSFGQCSRTCGGGVKRSVRECDNPRPANGGKYCVGRRVRYRSCNAQECPPGSMGFREEQCAAFNGKTVNIQGLPPNVKWLPQYSGITHENRCKLYCVVVGSTAYYLLKQKVIDGTPCGPDTYDICVNGECLPAGCDHQLHSDVKPDMCGICGGNNSTCKVVSGHYNRIQYGYNNVVLIPRGASNINVQQRGYRNTEKDDNYLALKTTDNQYILNGDYVVSMFHKTIQYGGTTIEYSGSDAVVESITTSTKPLTKEIYVQILTVGSLNPPDIWFQYAVSLADEDLYEWELRKEWTECNRVCKGEQYREPVCVRKEDRLVTNDGNCRSADRPSRLAQVCNLHCTLRWRITPLSHCTGPCKRGKGKRLVHCVQELNNYEVQLLQDQFCEHLGPKPSEEEECYGHCNKGHWEFGNWTECSVTCGVGDQSRSAICLDDNREELPESECEKEEKLVTKSCDRGTCPTWQVGDWTSCSVTCGKGERQRPYWCQHGGKEVSGTYCDKSSIPRHKDTCHMPVCAMWDHGNWGPCSATCGHGISHRVVGCRSLDGELLDSILCNSSEKPAEARECNMGPCPSRSQSSATSPMPSITSTSTTTTAATNEIPALPDNNIPHKSPHRIFHSDYKGTSAAPSSHSSQVEGIWRTGTWSECSVTCGKGVRTRYVTCNARHDGSTLPDNSCDLPSRPPNAERCSIRPCGQWRTGEWSQCPVTCGQGVSTRYVACMLFDEQLGKEEECDQETRPVSEILCNMPSCNLPPQIPSSPTDIITHNNVEGVYQWRVGHWGECSRTCGGGLKRRQVACYDESTKLSNLCDKKQKPPSTAPCNTERCPDWTTGEWNECSRSCGGGNQTRVVRCQGPKGQILPEHKCNIFTRPRASRGCNSHECSRRYVWRHRPWKACSVTCGSGTQHRQVFCVDGEQDTLVPSDRCEGSPPPPGVRECVQPPCPTWRFSDWSECSVSCGIGTQSREPVCKEGDAHVAASLCRTEKPETQFRPCSRSCGYRWHKEEWGKCSVPCGRGYKKRVVQCVNATGAFVKDELCHPQTKPKTLKRCRIRRCPYVWQVSEWSECSRTCGEGVETRSATCHRQNAYGWTDPEPVVQRLPGERWCNITERPLLVRACNRGSCAKDAVWKADDWRPCSVSCGIGRQRRRVRCYSPKTGRKISRSHCAGYQKPQRRRKCVMRSCELISCLDVQKRSKVFEDGEQEIFIRGHYVNIYCAKMNTSSPQEFIPLIMIETDNYSEFYSKRLRRSETCPNGGARMDTCDCVEDEESGAGLTSFHRIAVNITSLKVITTDFTFSRNEHGHQIPYGEAGDCYSSASCPQGRFSINLKGTGFMISPQTRWIVQGTMPSSRVQVLEDGLVVQGQCGGYCGRCIPESKTGLLLDVAPP